MAGLRMRRDLADSAVGLAATTLSLLPDGRRWPGGPDEGLPFPRKARRLRLASITTGSPSPLPLSHPGEGFPARLTRLARKPDAEPSPGGRGQGEGSDGLRMTQNLARACGWAGASLVEGPTPHPCLSPSSRRVLPAPFASPLWRASASWGLFRSVLWSMIESAGCCDETSLHKLSGRRSTANKWSSSTCC